VGQFWTKINILPYASVADDVQKGRLDAQVIVSPTIRRTLFVAYSRKPDLPRNELALTGIIRTALHALSPVLGTLGHPLLPDEA
jgi:LysR family nitrogen assimilation transcriptional regulator